jgi:PHD/YefM family antitoxin component YafN of YafNO toxin-antitoxin module
VEEIEFEVSQAASPPCNFVGSNRSRIDRDLFYYVFINLVILLVELYNLSKIANLEIFMSTSKTIASTEVQNNFGLILTDVIQNSTRYIIKRHNLPQAIILSLADFEQLLSNPKEQNKMAQVVRELAPAYKIGEAIEGK